MTFSIIVNKTWHSIMEGHCYAECRIYAPHFWASLCLYAECPAASCYTTSAESHRKFWSWYVFIVPMQNKATLALGACTKLACFYTLNAPLLWICCLEPFPQSFFLRNLQMGQTSPGPCLAQAGLSSLVLCLCVRPEPTLRCYPVG
jgi:hypothetical protein